MPYEQKWTERLQELWEAQNFSWIDGMSIDEENLRVFWTVNLVDEELKAYQNWVQTLKQKYISCDGQRFELQFPPAVLKSSDLCDLIISPWSYPEKLNHMFVHGEGGLCNKLAMLVMANYIPYSLSVKFIWNLEHSFDERNRVRTEDDVYFDFFAPTSLRPGFEIYDAKRPLWEEGCCLSLPQG